MGFCYDASTGQLVCDNCGTHGGCRRVKCPAGWCQATALCPACRKDPAVKAKMASYHVESDCAGSAAKFDAEQGAVAALQAAGEYVFCASSYEDGSDRKKVRCWFRKVDGEPTKVLVVSAAVRETFGRLTTYTEAVAAKDKAFMDDHFVVVHVAMPKPKEKVS